MKKALLPLLISSLVALSGCQKRTYNLDLKVACPSGAPAVAFYNYIQSDNLEVNSDPDNIISYFSETSNKDVIVAPTKGGLANIIKKNAPYKIASTLTFGNFFVLSTGHDDNSVMDEGDYVVLFQKDQIPDQLFSYVYSDILSDLDVHYVKAATDAATCAVTGKNAADDNHLVDYVLLAEPAVSNAMSKKDNLSVYSNIQEDYQTKTGNLMITQASLFVRNTLEKEVVDKFLSNLEKDVKDLLKDPGVLDKATKGMEDQLVTAKFLSPVSVLKGVLQGGDNNKMGLNYRNAYEIKDSIDKFMEVINGPKTTEEVYYK